MHFAALIIEIHIAGCSSLKEKRGHLKPLLAALHKNFNIAAAEVEKQDVHDYALIACVAVSGDRDHLSRVLNKLPDWIESQRPDLSVIDEEWLNL